MTTLTQLCQFCNEELLTSGDFKFRLQPAKRMPKRSLKLYHNTSNQRQTSNTFFLNKSKYQKYFHKLSIPNNKLEITCKNCLQKTCMKIQKPKYVPSIVKPSSATPLVSSLRKMKRQKKVKTPHDEYAGLIIPASMLPSPTVTPSQFPKDSQMHQSSLFTPNRKMTNSQSIDSKNQKDVQYPYQYIPHKKLKKMKQDEKKSKQREVNVLKKALFRSKEITNSGSISLNNFLDQS